MKLIEPTREYCRKIEAYRNAFLECGDSMDGTGDLRQFDNPGICEAIYGIYIIQ